MADYRVCAPGEHKARAISAALSTAKNGTEYVDVIFQLQDGGQISWTGWLGNDDKKNTWTIEALRHCGWKGDDLTDLSGIDSRMVNLKIEDDERAGDLRSQIKYVNRLGSEPIHRHKMSPIEARQLADRLKPLCQRVTAAPKTRSPQDKPQTYVSRATPTYKSTSAQQHRAVKVAPKEEQPWLPNPYGSDDDIPF